MLCKIGLSSNWKCARPAQWLKTKDLHKKLRLYWCCINMIILKSVFTCSRTKIRVVFSLGWSVWTERLVRNHSWESWLVSFIWVLVSILVKLFRMQECTSMTGERSFHSTTVLPQKYISCPKSYWSTIMLVKILVQQLHDQEIIMFLLKIACFVNHVPLNML